MPTVRRRHMITETDEIARAIDQAAEWWPELADNRAALLRRLVLTGAHSGAEEAARERMAFRKALDDLAGLGTGIFPPNAAQTLKEEWPE